MASPRDRAAWSHIFKLYKSLPYLWDKNNLNYGNRSMMTDGYKLLTRAYREKLDKQASVGALRMKMKNLRTTYYRELRKIKEANKKGVKYIPSLWYFDNLNFLANPNTTATSETSQTIDVEDSTQDLIQIDRSSPGDDLSLENSDMEYETEPSTSQPKPNAKGEPQKGTVILERQDIAEPSPKKSMKDEHWEVIGKSIGYQLKELNKKQYTIVSKLISDAIYFGRLNKLSEGSHIEIGPYGDSQSISTYSPSGHFSMGFHTVDVPTDRLQSSRFKHEENVEIDSDGSRN